MGQSIFLDALAFTTTDLEESYRFVASLGRVSGLAMIVRSKKITENLPFRPGSRQFQTIPKPETIMLTSFELEPLRRISKIDLFAWM